MVGHGGSSAGSYLADPTSPIPSHCASIAVTNTLRVNDFGVDYYIKLNADYGKRKWCWGFTGLHKGDTYLQ